MVPVEITYGNSQLSNNRDKIDAFKTHFRSVEVTMEETRWPNRAEEGEEDQEHNR